MLVAAVCIVALTPVLGRSTEFDGACLLVVLTTMSVLFLDLRLVGVG